MKVWRGRHSFRSEHQWSFSRFRSSTEVKGGAILGSDKRRKGSLCRRLVMLGDRKEDDKLAKDHVPIFTFRTALPFEALGHLNNNDRSSGILLTSGSVL